MTNNLPVPKTLAQRQAAWRTRQTLSELVEVRGIYLPRDVHRKLRELAKSLQPGP